MSSQAEAGTSPADESVGLAEEFEQDEVGANRKDGVGSESPQIPANPSITTQAGMYLGLRYGLGVLVSIGNMFVLTWWIGPHAYGIFITAIGLTAFLASLTRGGVDTYLVRQAAAPDERMYSVASTLTGAFSLILMLVGAAAIPLLARWYGNHEFVPAYAALLLTIPLVGLTGPPTAKLERDLNFRVVAKIELGGQLLALLVSLTLAWLGMGVWAPVLGHLTWQIFGVTAAVAAAKLLPRIRFDGQCAREMLRFGTGYTASLRTWQLRTLVNPLLVGRFAGSEGVAFVGLAIRIAEGLGFIRVAAARLAIAALARLQNDEAKFHVALQNALKIQVVVLGPLLCTFALLGPFVVERFMGTRWTPSLRVYPFIAAGVLINSVFNLQASALFVVGRQWLVLKSYATHVLLLTLGTLLFLPRLGIAGYGWADLMACLGYWLLQSGSSPAIEVCHRRLVPWVLGFAAPLFAPFVHSAWKSAFCLPLFGAVGYEIWQSSRSPGWSTQRQYGGFTKAVVVKTQHLITFLFKARRRGLKYVYAVLLYHMRSRDYRLGLNLRRGLSRSGLGAWKQSLAKERSSPSRHSLPPRHEMFHFKAEDILAIVASIPGSIRARTLTEAGRALCQSFHFRGRELAFASNVVWQARPDGNISWEWDLNRHRYFVTLGTAYYYSGRRDYLDKLVELWESWIAGNPVCRTDAWRQPFEVASRLRNWMWAYFLIERSALFPQQRLGTLLAAIREHGAFLHSSLEYHWPNNHLLLEAKTLYEYARLFPQFDVDQRIASRAWRVLEHEIQSQILADGGHSELCSMYHRIIAGELNQLAILCRKLARPLPKHIEERIRSLVDFSRALQRDDGSSPLLGDSAPDDTNLRFDFAAPERSELTYWTQWKNESDLILQEGRTTTRALQIFPDSGYAFLRCGEGASQSHLSFDFGALSRCLSANHAHVDALSFELYVAGRALMVDPGVYLPWDDDGSWSGYFRSSAAHNTLVLDGREQSQLCRYADVRRTAITRLVEYWAADGEASVTAECIPHWSEHREIRHTRTITSRAGGHVSIGDRVIGSGRHCLDWYFHAAPEIDAVEAGVAEFSLRSPGSEMELAHVHARASETPSLKFVRGQMQPRQGWVSVNSAEVLPAWVAIYSAEVELPFSITFEVDIQ